MDAECPDFTTTYSKGDNGFDASSLFNYKEWQKKDNYLKIIAQEGIDQDYAMHADWQIVILCLA